MGAFTAKNLWMKRTHSRGGYAANVPSRMYALSRPGVLYWRETISRTGMAFVALSTCVALSAINQPHRSPHAPPQRASSAQSRENPASPISPMGYASGGAVNSGRHAPRREEVTSSSSSLWCIRCALKADGAAPKHRADKRARGGKVKLTAGATINIINSPGHA